MTTPCFVPDSTVRRMLSDQARAGGDVRLLLPSEHTDAKPVRLAGHYHFEELLAAGVRIWEYQPTMLHSKGVVVDGIWAVVGSANLNLRSRELDHENLLGISHTGLARQDGGGLPG